MEIEYGFVSYFFDENQQHQAPSKKVVHIDIKGLLNRLVEKNIVTRQGALNLLTEL